MIFNPEVGCIIFENVPRQKVKGRMKNSFKFQGQKGFRVKVEGFRFRFFRVFRMIRGKMKIAAAVFSFCLFPLALAAGWPPVALTNATPWGEAVTPQNIQGAYPRPTLARAEWQSLNGLWDYSITSVEVTNPAQWLFSAGSNPQLDGSAGKMHGSTVGAETNPAAGLFPLVAPTQHV